MKYWYALMTSPAKEFEVADELSAMGIEVYCPTRIEQRRPRRMKLAKGRTIEVKKPLYSRYLFYTCAEWDAPLSLKHVKAILMTGEQIAQIRDDDIAKLKTLEAEGFFNEEGFTSSLVFASGDRVQITEGILEGRKGVFIGAGSGQAAIDVFANRGRIRISIPVGMIDHV